MATRALPCTRLKQVVAFSKRHVHRAGFIAPAFQLKLPCIFERLQIFQIATGFGNPVNPQTGKNKKTVTKQPVFC